MKREQKQSGEAAAVNCSSDQQARSDFLFWRRVRASIIVMMMSLLLSSARSSGKMLLHSLSTAPPSSSAATAAPKTWRTTAASMLQQRPWLSIRTLLVAAATAMLLLGAPLPAAADGNTVFGDQTSRALCNELSIFARVRPVRSSSTARRDTQSDQRGIIATCVHQQGGCVAADAGLGLPLSHQLNDVCDGPLRRFNARLRSVSSIYQRPPLPGPPPFFLHHPAHRSCSSALSPLST